VKNRAVGEVTMPMRRGRRGSDACAPDRKGLPRELFLELLERQLQRAEPLRSSFDN
jgi:hypothetical protein